MAFPPSFLDEIRGRISVSDICGKRVKLMRRGREFVGLSPFNNEKTPSFTVNDEKGFYHCFSSGKHGDIFSFIMETEGLSFPEVVERLATDAGVPIPRETPRDEAREKRRASLYEVTEAACQWFESALQGLGGADAAAYLRGRGLDDATIARFRLGFAPDGRAMAQALTAQGLDEALLLEAGLLRRPDDGRSPYAFFRDRVMFPIADRRGRIIAFGGRLMGDAKAAKYINSPDTPLFDKGRTLYNLAGARQAAHESGQLLVTEGYMDVIALAGAGFEAAVAPLGTALTEAQIQEIWRLAVEPMLCFDGDAAGQRAAHRAAERVLPHLQPGKSLRFAYLPAGEDPDSLVRNRGAEAMRRVIEGAKPLADMVWDMEVQARPVDTPERRADLEVRLKKRVAEIGDATVRQYYDDMLRDRLWNAFRGARGPVKGRAGGQVLLRPTPPSSNLASLVAAGPRRRQQALLAMIVNHPVLHDQFAETLATVELDPDLDKIRQNIHDLLAITPDLDSESLKRHLCETMDSGALQGLLGKDVQEHIGFARSGAPLEAVQAGVRALLASEFRESRRRELLEQGRRADAEGTADSEARFLRILSELEQAENEIAELED